MWCPHAWRHVLSKKHKFDNFDLFRPDDPLKAWFTLHSRYRPIFSNAFHYKHSHWQSHSSLAPVTLRSRSNQKIFRPERDWSESGAWLSVWTLTTVYIVTVLEGLSEGVLLVRSACHVVYLMEMKKAQEKQTEARADHKWSEECVCTRILTVPWMERNRSYGANKTRGFPKMVFLSKN